ncbi:MAG: hypothetical protein U1C74_13280 [Phenylobacterium sp.]|nr:hypothetical protein [Phenylobacterium sp.]
MQNFRCVSAVAAMALCAPLAMSAPAQAQTPGHVGEARLVTPAPAPVAQTISGVDWRCEGEQCQGAAARRPNLDGVVRECKKVVAVIGPVASYRSGGRDLTAGQIRACNKGAIQVQTARN